MRSLKWMASACLCAALFSLSCAGINRYTRREKVQFTLHLWVQEHPGLSRDVALKGCEEWLPKGVSCTLAASPDEADVRVSADESACVPDKDGKRTLALAYKGGDVVFMVRCFQNADDTYDLHQYHAVMAHEVGHELGVWEHVPEDCDDKAKKPICGRAVMNPYYDKDVWFITEIDSLAFDMRDMDYSVIVPLGSDSPSPPSRPKPEGPDCTFFGK